MTESLQELRERAESLGIDVHHRHGEQKIREMIAEVEKENSPIESDAVRVKMRNDAGHELAVLSEFVSEYKSKGWRQVGG
jgi:hypothetical protein